MLQRLIEFDDYRYRNVLSFSFLKRSKEIRALRSIEIKRIEGKGDSRTEFSNGMEEVVQNRLRDRAIPIVCPERKTAADIAITSFNRGHRQ